MAGFSRRGFIKVSAVLGAAGSLLPFRSLFSGTAGAKESGKRSGPIVISTWKHGLAANEAAWQILSGGGSALDAVESGVRVPEGDPEVTSVGFGGYPDEDCRVTLDASIMGPDGNCGSVAFVEGYKHPISIARKVMEETDHELLVGSGAEEFARKQGFPREDLLTEKARRGWLKWKSGLSDRDDWIPPTEDHDTIGMVALDSMGHLSGACTTSGLAFKIHGRVGDSPIIGSGMYVDGGIGAAAATGRGEAVIKVCGSFLVVEYMRQGLSPKKACIRALQRIIENQGGKADFQVGFIAVDINGKYGAASLEDGFEFAVANEKGNELYKAEYIV